ncbi:MAG: DedA family protein, partial [Actinomycetota bacterium]
VAFALVRGPANALIARWGPRVGLTPERLARVSSVLERKGRTALALSRSTPGLRTASVVAAGASGVRARSALPRLIVGSTIFVEGHFLLGLALGSVARRVLAKATIVLAGFLMVLVAGGLFFWLRRRRTSGERGGASKRSAKLVAPPVWPSPPSPNDSAPRRAVINAARLKI